MMHDVSVALALALVCCGVAAAVNVPASGAAGRGARVGGGQIPLPRFVQPSARRYGMQQLLPGFFDVTDYGAKGDNATDNTDAFQKALAAAQTAAGGVVYVPPGLYRFKGNLVVPPAVTLQGSYDTVPSHDCRQGDYPNDGSVLMPLANRGNDSADPFITVQHDATLHGFVVYHVEQTPNAMPVPYPFAIALVGNNAAVTDVEILNAWNGVSAVAAHRHYIARIQGQPLNIGIFIDQTYDIGRMEDVHFNPWFSVNKEFMYWQTTYGRAFVLGRSDWEYVFNTFAFAYAVGYHFVETSTGSMNGNFLGIGADYACNASVKVDASQPAGLLITNGEFTAFHNNDFAPNSTAIPSQVVVSPSNTGPVKFVTSSFWGPTDSIARLQGSGTTTFSSCSFVQWDLAMARGTSAILAEGGNTIVQGCDFQDAKSQLHVSAAAKKVVFANNVGPGPLNITGAGAGIVVSAANAF
ncbi:hypothetical protein PTSG_12225 [Salpingoeca rosetta]|uniref:Rhamnogalacturonase A/B/Epimerase-like pectate lyase domain-containing protein n=1 Tax=Salpingoeca rosetta (strain ATCC 50818 / BSB-021) TaxID=946362 RepID=F2U8Y5_SALR5|nr:uncharacterized protein PTSG_12225 [Salpingoeca rosetta]EGD73188.1 hypothetical protein PTSG_12225 [Salpingoeca rosetta]|eukprot:XP_004994219.1 hypothetical protein PTSG_12225 [Salpingoeca rosetta]